VEDIYATLKAANRLPTLPAVAIRIIELASSEATSIEDVAEAIQCDPALTARILKCLSSPLFGLGFGGSTLAEAVARIGLRGTQMMALSFTLVSQKHRAACASFAFDRFWSESLGRAVAARCLARHLRGWDPEEAFITGLLARIGQLVFATGAGTRYEAVLSGVGEGLAADLARRERAEFGIDHLELGERLLRDWQLPEIVWKTIGNLSGEATDVTRAVRIVRIADGIAQFLTNVARHNADDVRLLTDEAVDQLEVEAGDFRELLEEVGQNWTIYGQMLSVPTSKVPDLALIEEQAEERRMALEIASEIEVNNLRAENEQLGQEARRDRLTGLFNRASFDDALPQALVEAAATGDPLTLLMIDADHFKSVNDTHGHQVGDGVLRHLAGIIQANLPETARAFRYGGEEFAVIAPACGTEPACGLAETIRTAVERTPYVEAALRLDLTVSMGVAVTEVEGVPPTAVGLIAWADERLYEAKRGGRNAWRIRPPEKTRVAWWRRIGRVFSRSN